METITYSDWQLLDDFLKGRASYNVLYDAYFNKIRTYFLSKIRDYGIAEQLAQDVFAGLLECSPSKADKNCEFLTYLFSIAENKKIDYLRSQQIRRTASASTQRSTLNPNSSEIQRTKSHKRYLKLLESRLPILLANINNPDPAKTALTNENLDIINRCLSGLAQREQAVLLLNRFYNVPLNKIAIILNLENERIARYQMVKGIENLLKCLQKADYFC